jgi:ketosteroid isomerase-like protein
MQVRRDVATATRLLADDCIFTQADGNVTNKAGNIEIIGSPDFVCQSLTTDDVQVRVYGDTALVLGRATMKAIYKGQDVGGEFRYTDV